jgi:hypothetical protein
MVAVSVSTDLGAETIWRECPVRGRRRIYRPKSVAPRERRPEVGEVQVGARIWNIPKRDYTV